MVQGKVKPPPVHIISDRPAIENLLFGFDAYADALSGLVANKENTTPLVMGVHGLSGTGKTTLMKAIKARLDGDTPADTKRYRRCKTVWLQISKYDRGEEILATVVEAIFKAMAADGFFSLARPKIDTVVKRIDKSQIFASVSKLVGGADISEFFTDLPNKEKLGFYDTFLKFFDDLIWTFLNWRFKLSGQEKPDDRKCAFVIFIDDLDRCHPGRIVQVLETIERFLNRSGCIFVLGADAGTLERALIGEYGLPDIRPWMEKIFQVSFLIPQVLPEVFNALIEEKQNFGPLFKEYLPVIVPALGDNPRQFKRFVNDLNLLKGLFESINSPISIEKVLCWRIIDCVFGDLAEIIRDNPANLGALQEQIDRLADVAGHEPQGPLTDEQLHEQQVPASWHTYLQTPYLADIVARLDVSPEELNRLITLSAAVKPAGNYSTP